MSATFPWKKWMLESYAKRVNNSWKEINIDKQSSYLALAYPLLIIALDDMTVVKLVCVDLSGKAGKVEVHHFEDNVGIQTTDEDDNISKIRMSFESDQRIKTGSDYCNEVVDELRKFIPVIRHQPRPLNDENLEDQPVTFRQTFMDLVIHLYRSIPTHYRPTPQAFDHTDSYLENYINEFMLHPQCSERALEIWEELDLNLSDQ